MITVIPRGGGGGGVTEIDVEINNGILRIDAEAEYTITPVSGSAAFGIDNATTVIVDGSATLTSLILSALSATNVSLGGITVTESFSLFIDAPATLGMPASAESFTFGCQLTSIALPNNVISIGSSTSNLLDTIDNISSSGNLNNVNIAGANLQTATKDALLARCVAGGESSGVFITTGGQSPTLDIPATSGTGQIVCPSAASLELTGAGSWVKPRWKTTERYFWFNVDSLNTDPAPGGAGVEIAISSINDAATVAFALEAAMEDNGYTAELDGTQVNYELDETGSGNTNASQDAGADFTLQGETDGTNAANSDANTLIADSWTVNFGP